MERLPSFGLVAGELAYLVRNGGIGTSNWLLAHLLAAHGWRGSSAKNLSNVCTLLPRLAPDPRQMADSIAPSKTYAKVSIS